MKTNAMAGLAVFAMCTLMMGCMSKKEIEKGEAQMKKPVTAATAQEDIRLLESEKARAGQEITSGASSIIPIGAVVNMLQLKERDSLEVGCGEYNRMIDAKIAEIKKEYNIQ